MSIFDLFVKGSHKKLWNIQILCLGLEGSVIFADHFSGSFKPFLFEIFWNSFLNIDQVQAVFLFSFVAQIVLKLQIFCVDPQFLFSFGSCTKSKSLYSLPFSCSKSDLLSNRFVRQLAAYPRFFTVRRLKLEKINWCSLIIEQKYCQILKMSSSVSSVVEF